MLKDKRITKESGNYDGLKVNDYERKNNSDAVMQLGFGGIRIVNYFGTCVHTRTRATLFTVRN